MSTEPGPTFSGGPEFRSECDYAFTSPQMNWTFQVNEQEFDQSGPNYAGVNIF